MTAQRVAVISDPHIDIDNNAWPDATRFDGDVLIVIGDTAAPLTKGLRWMVDNLLGSVSRCLYVPGNHDFYKGLPGSGEENTYYQEQMERGYEIARSLGVDLLQNDVIEIDGVRYAGGTGWTDFGVLPPGWSRKMAMYYSQNGKLPGGEPWAQRDRHNDFVEIRYGGGNSKHRFTPSQWLQLHLESFGFFKRVLATPFDGPTVCITHMGPASSVKPGMHSWLYGSSDFDALCRGPNAPDYWLHGHVHKSLDYEIEIGKTRVVCNPRGYPDPRAPSGRENPDFDPTLTIELGPDLTPTLRI